MSRHQREQQKLRANAIRFVALVAFAAVLTGLIVVALGDPRLDASRTYDAVFTDVSGLEEGSSVRAAGVEVGVVAGLRLLDDATVEVTLEVEQDVPLTRTTEARVRYANLTGDRYVDLTAPIGETAERLADGATIPASRTAPAVDLDLLFNGFRPLTQALAPDEVNQLTQSVIAVSQGQGGALDELLGRVGSLTSTLGDRSVVIEAVIDNLTTVLGTVDDRDGEVARLLDGLDDLVGGLADDRRQLGEALEALGGTADSGATFLEAVRPGLRELVTEVRRTSEVFNGNADQAERYLRQIPDGIRALGRGGAYGSYFNFYLCGVRFKTGTSGENLSFTPFFLATEERCQF